MGGGYSQNLNVNLLPDTGNVGIGTLNPIEKFEVVGTSKMDGEVKITGKTIMEKKLKIQDSITIYGSAIINGDLQIVSYADTIQRMLVVDTDGKLIAGEPLKEINCAYDEKPMVVGSNLNRTAFICWRNNVGVGTDNAYFKFTTLSDIEDHTFYRPYTKDKSLNFAPIALFGDFYHQNFLTIRSFAGGRLDNNDYPTINFSTKRAYDFNSSSERWFESNIAFGEDDINSILFINGTKKNVGIGTSTPHPEARLHVDGSVFLLQSNPAEQFQVVHSSYSLNEPKYRGIQLASATQAVTPNKIGFVNFFVDHADPQQFNTGFDFYVKQSVIPLLSVQSPGTKENGTVNYTPESGGNGKVGVNTGTPKATLDVAGNLKVNNSVKYHGGADKCGLIIEADINQANHSWKIAAKDKGMELNCSDAVAAANPSFSQTPKMVILNTGEIGVGIATPTYKLEVNGNIRCREVLVEDINWPDYVFENNYHLMSINDLELFVKQHKHLPQIKSKEECKSGVSVAQTQEALLQKIEELTLYIIELNKRIEYLERR